MDDALEAQITLTDGFDNTKSSSPMPVEVAHYQELSDDDEELAFGITVGDNDYMHQYKKHNRINSKYSSPQTILSPTAHKHFAEYLKQRQESPHTATESQHKDIEAIPKAPTPKPIVPTISVESVGTLNAMTQGIISSYSLNIYPRKYDLNMY